MLQVEAHAKCLIAGEHAVLTGAAAVVAPVRSKTLSVQYTKGGKRVVECQDPLCAQLFEKTLDQCCQLLQSDLEEGHFFLTNNIPIGAGLGFSAALCVAATKWLIQRGFLAEDQLFPFAHKLEHVYHGESSGVDIVGAMSTSFMRFERQNFLFAPIHHQWNPLFYVSFSGEKKSTESKVNLVKQLRQQQPELARAIDQKMGHSSDMVEQALGLNEEEGIKTLVSAIDLAKDCFEQWGLITPPMQQQMDSLLQAGALAVKPTGAGGGGFLLTLWKKKPTNLTIELIEI